MRFLLSLGLIVGVALSVQPVYGTDAVNEPALKIAAGPSVESLITQRAGQEAAKTPGIRDYLRGGQELQAGNFAGAIEAYSKAIEANDENWQDFQARGVAYALSNQFAPAKSDFNRALQLSSNAKIPQLFLSFIKEIDAGPNDRGMYSPTAYDAFGYDLLRWAMDLKYGKKADDLKQITAKLAGEFGSSLTHGPHSAAIMLEQANGLAQQGKFAQSLAIIQAIEPFYMNDTLWLYVKGADDVAAGRWEDAREEYTRVLDDRPDLPAAYLARALAAAHLGEARRVTIDLAAAGQLDAKTAKEFDAKHGKEIHDLLAEVPKQSAYDLAAAMIQDAQKGVALSKLIEDARAVELASNAVRRHADEQYNDGLRQRVNLTAADPRNAQRWADLATYVYLEARVRTVWNGPHNQPQDLRNQNHEQYMRERQLAEQYADKALAVDGRNVTAIATKAWLLHMREADGDAGTLVERGLQVAPDYPRLVKLKSALLSEQAAAEFAAATRLRSSKMFSGPGWWVTISPSQAELNQAQAYENYSSQLFSQANSAERAAYEKYSNTLMGLVSLGDYFDWIGDEKQAIAKYEEALKLDPDEIQSLEGLRDIYAEKLNEPGKALEYQVRAISTMQTTAAPLLEVAWQLVGKARWTTARKSLDEAMKLDPADGRVYAYNATLFSWQDKPQESAPFWRCALALDEARMNLNGQTLLKSAEPLTRQDSLMGIMATWGLFRDQMAMDKPDDALENLKLSNDLKVRTTLTSSRTDLPFMGMPAPDNPGGNVPASENVPLMMSKANMLMAKAELDKGDLEKAAQQLTAVRNSGYSGNDPKVRSFVDNTSYDIYLKLKKKYDFNQLQKFFDGQELHEFDMRDRGVGYH